MLTGLQATYLFCSGIEGVYQICAVCCISATCAVCESVPLIYRLADPNFN